METKENRKSGAREKVARNVAKGIGATQQRWASFMSRLVSRFSISAQKRGLIIFSVLFGVYCTCLIAGGFSNKQKNSMPNVNKMTIPKLQSDEIPAMAETDSLIEVTVRDFYRKRDSLLKTDPQQWQWLIDNRPGLIDSIEQLESYIK